MYCHVSVYNAFIKYKSQSKWCHDHFLNYRALARATAVRRQLLFYLKRLHIDLISCGDRPELVQKCIAAGYFLHAAKLQKDGSYLSLRGNMVRSKVQPFFNLPFGISKRNDNLFPVVALILV